MPDKERTMIISLLDTRAQIRTVAARWKRQYFDAVRREWGSTVLGSSMAIYERLRALDVETATPADVAAIIGNRGWVEESCDGCGTYDAPLVHVGETPDYEARYLFLCEACVRKVAAAFKGVSDA